MVRSIVKVYIGEVGSLEKSALRLASSGMKNTFSKTVYKYVCIVQCTGGFVSRNYSSVMAAKLSA